MNFTPIVVDKKGKVKEILSENALYKYGEAVVDGRRKDSKKIKIGKTFNGRHAIDNAVDAAIEIHELQAIYYKV